MAIDNPYKTYQRGVNAPAANAFNIEKGTPLLTAARAFYVGTGGHVKVRTLGGTIVTFANVNSGTVIPCSITEVLGGDNETTADNIIGLE